MKFGKFFEFGVHEEWREFYLPYEELHRLLREAAARLGKGGASASSTPAAPRAQGKGGASEDLRAPLLAQGGAVSASDARSPAPAAAVSAVSRSLAASREEERRAFAARFFAALDKTERFYRSREAELGRMLDELIDHTADLGAAEREAKEAKRKKQQKQQHGQKSRPPSSSSAAGEGVSGSSSPSRADVYPATYGATGAAEPRWRGGRHRPSPARAPASPSAPAAAPGKSFWTRTTDRRRVRKNWLTIYKMIANLKGFGQLNYTAARKVAKKWDKSVRTRHTLTAEFMERSGEYLFWCSPTVDALMTRVEEAYAEYFNRGDVKAALVELQRVRTKVPLFDMLHLGFNVGVLFAVVLAFFVVSQVGSSTYLDTEEVVDMLPVFRAAVCVALFAWCWGLLVRTWTAYNINHAYMFDFNPQTTLTFVEILKIASAMTAMLAVSTFLYYAALLTGSDDMFGVPAKFFVVAVLVLFAAFLLNPFDFFHRPTRRTLYRNIFKVITAPLWKVRFVDVYVGDVITSMVHPLSDIQYTVCYYSSSTPTTCRRVRGYVLPVVAALPYLWRGAQCLRRYRDTGNKLNLVNAGKYLSGVSVTVLGLLYADFVSESMWDTGRIIWFSVFVVEVMYMYTWDILQDWGFRPLTSSNFLLRDTLVYNRRWLYYWAIVTNFFARWVWALTITPFRFTSSRSHHELITLALSVCEILRRFQWSFIRVENEFLANNESLRSVATVVPPGAHYHGGKLLHAGDASGGGTGGLGVSPTPGGRGGTGGAGGADHGRSYSVSAAWSPAPQRPAHTAAAAAGGARHRAASENAGGRSLLFGGDDVESGGGVGGGGKGVAEGDERGDDGGSDGSDADLSDDEIHESPIEAEIESAMPLFRSHSAGSSPSLPPLHPGAGSASGGAWLPRAVPSGHPPVQHPRAASGAGFGAGPRPAAAAAAAAAAAPAGTHGPAYFYSAALSPSVSSAGDLTDATAGEDPAPLALAPPEDR